MNLIKHVFDTENAGISVVRSRSLHVMCAVVVRNRLIILAILLIFFFTLYVFLTDNISKEHIRI